MISMANEIIYNDIDKLNPFIYNLKKLIDWDRMVKVIENRLPRKTSKLGRPAYPVSMMLKITILQELHNLSDDAVEMHINGNIYYKYFLDMDILDKSPDAKTIWLFKETL
ncbi:MAG: transposase, partial [Spirochaetota bacterium]